MGRILVNYYIDQILKKQKITSFLEERGIYPDRKTGEKLVYYCPVHSGDNDPSFIVYPEGVEGRDYQTYHCYGCHSGISIINLKSDLDKESTKESIKYFLKGIKIDNKDVIDSIIEDISKGELDTEYQKDIETTLLMINNTCREHLFNYRDYKEISFFEDFFKETNKVARSRNIELLEKIYDMLIAGLDKRVEKFQRRQEDKEISSTKWVI